MLRPILSFAPVATRESRELGVYCFLVLAAAGLSAWVWFRNRCTPGASTVAAVAYISLPYTIGQALYSRVAIGELTAFVWMPLMLALCDRVQRSRFGMPIAIGAMFALLVLSNVLYAALFVPFIVLYAVVSGKRVVLPVLLALALGTCIAAVYVFPLVAYQHLFDAGAVIAHHDIVALGHHFLYISSGQVRTYPFAVPALVTVTCLTLLVAWYVWRGVGALRPAWVCC